MPEPTNYQIALAGAISIASDGLPGGPVSLAEALLVADPLLQSGWKMWSVIDALRGMAQLGTIGAEAGRALLEVNGVKAK